MNATLTTKLLSVLVVVCLVGGGVSLVVMKPWDKGDGDDGPKSMNYVSLGASNTNGYGMRGYISEEDIAKILSGEVSKDDINVYGYKKLPDGSYPELIRDYYVGLYGEDNVTVNQLAISSMRVEELRILLDKDYDGDDYSSWRFTGENGWFEAAEEGGIEALRDAYAQAITGADMITLDIGWNNFGVYVCNQIVDFLKTGQFKWTTDVTTIFDTDEEDQAALQAKEVIRSYVQSNVGTGDLSNALTDIFAYGILGYMHNFDIVVDRIYALNPDVDLVVIGIQNLLHGAVVELGGQEMQLGDIFGNFVDMANYYSSVCSPNHDRYLYIKPGTNGHVSIFLELMKGYDGDPSSLNQNVKDCFDYYDENLSIQLTLDMTAAQMIEEEYGPFLPALGFESGAEAVAAGKQKLLPDFIQSVFDELYWPALDAAYDTLAELVKVIATMPSVKGDALLEDLDIGAMESQLRTLLMGEITENVTAAIDKKEYVVDVDKVFPDDAMKLVASIYVRFYLGNSFFAHPSEVGHEEIKNATIQILNDPSSETDQPLRDDLAQSVRDIQQLLCGATGHHVSGGMCAVCEATVL